METRKTRIIAEIGSNYNNDLELAKTYIKLCSEVGADAVKFQTLRKDLLISRKIWSEGKVVDNPIYDIVVNLELPDEWHFELKKEADKHGIEFLSTPFYLEAVDLLENVGVRTYKVASGDITFFPLLKKIGETQKKVILSTGASNLDDIQRALDVLTESGTKNISILHCVANYPPAWDEMNISTIKTLKEEFGIQVGISDHSPGSLIPLASVALGATIVEKHVTLSRSLPGPDHPFAMTLDEFGDMISEIRKLEKAFGDSKKKPTPEELKKQNRIRRGLYNSITHEPTDRPDGVWMRPQY
jgi:N,N'-diacetyllegionaminate synthase